MHRWAQSELVAKLKDVSEQNAVMGEALEHAIIKIKKMSTKRYKQYTEKAFDSGKRIKSQGRYTRFIQNFGALPPNEHLLLPSLEDVKGIYINLDSINGIDHAFELKKALEQRQKARGIRQYNSAVLYRPTLRRDSNYFRQAGWAQALLPWSSQGLIEFAKTGVITAEDGKAFAPDHTKLLNIVSTAAYFLGNLPDVAEVKERNNNLLHVAIESGREQSVIKFFVSRKVSPTEIGEKGKSAIAMAKDCDHPSLDFLTRESVSDGEPSTALA